MLGNFGFQSKLKTAETEADEKLLCSDECDVLKVVRGVGCVESEGTLFLNIYRNLGIMSLNFEIRVQKLNKSLLKGISPITYLLEFRNAIDMNKSYQPSSTVDLESGGWWFVISRGTMIGPSRLRRSPFPEFYCFESL